MTRGRASNRRGEVARVYDRIAGIYDPLEALMAGPRGPKRRRRLLARARGRVLEVGVGTGRNLPYYPEDVELVGIDFAPRMLARARKRARELGRHVHLQLADAEALPFEDETFDTVVGTAVFCSVPDPVQGLREVRRVVRSNGLVLLLEHVRPVNRILGRIFDRLTPLTRRLIGPEINRRTEENVRAAGLRISEVRKEGIWREIVARKA